MAGNNIEKPSFESHNDAWEELRELGRNHHEFTPGQTTENLESDPSLSSQEKETEINKARERVESAYDNMRPSLTELPNNSPMSIPEATPPVRQNPVARVLKRAAAVTGNAALTLASATTLAFSPAFIPLAIPAMGFAIESIIHNIRGINGSMFEVSKSNRISQRVNPFPSLIKYRGETSTEIFDQEIEKLFEGLTPGETYTTRSHIVTYHRLRMAQAAGRITDLKREKSGNSRLILECIATGNWKQIRRGKKYDMYDISFKVT